MVPLHHKHQESFENFESCVCVRLDALHLFRSTFITLPNSPKFVNPFLKYFFPLNSRGSRNRVFHENTKVAAHRFGKNPVSVVRARQPYRKSQNPASTPYSLRIFASFSNHATTCLTVNCSIAPSDSAAICLNGRKDATTKFVKKFSKLAST